MYDNLEIYNSMIDRYNNNNLNNIDFSNCVKTRQLQKLVTVKTRQKKFKSFV